MNFVLKPSLEHMALVKIGVTLWNQNDIRALLANRSFSLNWNYRNVGWKNIEGRVIEKVPQLSLPQLIKEKVLGVIKPIGLEILNFREFHSNLFLYIPIPDELWWTPLGTVDRKRTVKVLVKDESLDISTRYKLACIYCLEDSIHEFWSNMSEDLKNSFLDTQLRPINDWSRNMMRSGLGNAHISYKEDFQQRAKKGNKVAAEYYLRKLTPQERKESLVETAKYVHEADFLCFLLSEMDDEQQIDVFKHRPHRVLQCFLQWPLQSFFIGVASCMWDYLSKYDYDGILTIIIYKVADGYKDWNYQTLFREFWLKSPNGLKSLITNEFDKSYVQSHLFRIKDKENIRLILKDATFKTKKKLIYSDYIKDFFKCSILNNEWDFLGFFIRECLPSQNEMLVFKEEFEKYITKCCVIGHFAGNKQKWDQLFCFSDDSICRYDKRSVEAESCSSKRFRNSQ